MNTKGPFPFSISFWIFAMIGLVLPTQSSLGAGQDLVFYEELKAYAVHVVQFPTDSWLGNGVYLGNGSILTAAHVAGGFWKILRVQIAGQTLTTRVVKRGQFETVDLAVLSIDDAKLPVSLRLRRMPICEGNPRPGEAVIVATPEEVAESHVIAPRQLPRNIAPKYQTAISDVATTGNSGSGVFDEDRQCLLGIISAKIWEGKNSRNNPSLKPIQHDIAKYFVPAPLISAFLGSQ
jgi:S1-C subfamily serine protease